MPQTTPFFQGFGPLLFGRAPKKAIDQISRIKSLDDLYAYFGEMIPGQIFTPPDKGPGSRVRLLPTRVTFWAFVAQVMSPGMSCREVVRKVEAWWRWSQLDRRDSLTASAYCQARGRLDLSLLESVGKSVSTACVRNVLRGEKWFGGREVKVVDGTGLSMPDTPENQEVWPQPKGQKPGVGFPQMRLVGLFDLASGALVEHAASDVHTHEIELFRSIWPRLHRGDIILGDRAFCSYGTLASLGRQRVDSVMRLHARRKVDFRKGTALGKDDRLMVWNKPQRPDTWSKEEYDRLPDQLEVRLIRLQVKAQGFRTKEVILATTLTDPQTYPADAIRELYAKRWNVELHFQQIKTHLDLDILRCKSPDLIEKELLVHLIAYNMVRALMQKSAHIHDVPLERISFKGALDTIRQFAETIHAASRTPRKQRELIDRMLALMASDPVPERPERSEPRAKKRRPKNYKLLTKPRHQTGNLPHRNRPKPKKR